MHVSIKQFNDEQKLWYSKLLIATIKADDVVDEAELDYVIQAFNFLKPEQKQLLSQLLKLPQQLPGLEKIPPGLDHKMLLTIYTQMVMVSVADTKLTVKEQSFLNKVRGWFGFTGELEKDLNQWTSDVLDLVKRRQQLLESCEQPPAEA